MRRRAADQKAELDDYMTSDEHQQRFQQLYDAYSGPIFAYAARRTADAQDAADVVSDTFLVAWRRLQAVPLGEEARPWLYAVAQRTLANHRRGERRRIRLEGKISGEFAAFVGHPTEPSDLDFRAISSAFGQLSDRDRELLTLVAWDGLEPADLALVYECSAATVRLRLHRARNRFKQHLSEENMKRSDLPGHVASRWATAHLDQEES